MFRLLTSEDLPCIQKIEQVCFSSPWSQAQLLSALQNSRYYFCGYFQPALVGFACFSTLLDEAELLQIAIAPEAQKQGCATKLLDESFNALRGLGVSRTLLEVRASNHSAISLYRKLGFQEDGCRKGYYPPENEGNSREDAILMSYSLAS